MLKIVLKNGVELLNDPELGINLDTKEEIKEILDSQGYYDLFTEEKGWQRIYRYDIKEIINA